MRLQISLRGPARQTFYPFREALWQMNVAPPEFDVGSAAGTMESSGGFKAV